MAAPIILCDTAGMSEARWLACREHGPKGDIEYTVGGSDVAAIFGLSPWTTPLELWMQKKGRMKTKPKSNAGQLEMGHLLEPIAAHFFAQKTRQNFLQHSLPDLRSARVRETASQHQSQKERVLLPQVRKVFRRRSGPVRLL